VTDFVIVSGEDDGRPKRLVDVEQFLSEVETFIRGLRRWDWKEVVYDSEVYMAALKLSEDPEFVGLLRAELSRQLAPVPAERVELVADAAPEVIAGFFDALIAYMEKEKGKLT
jgi:hypothetical protein